RPRRRRATSRRAGSRPRSAAARRAAPGRRWSRRQDVDRAAVDRELPAAIAVDLENLVDQVRHFDFEIVITLRGLAGRRKADAQAPGRPEILLADHDSVHEVHVLRRIGGSTVFADQAYV